MKKLPLLVFLVSILSIFNVTLAYANGEATYKQVCFSCHGAGVAGAPKVGDKAKWAPLIKEGQIHITSDGYSGVRAMPAKGGKPDLSVEQFASAVVYMANQSGASWSDPDPKTLAIINEKIEKRQKKSAKK